HQSKSQIQNIIGGELEAEPRRQPQNRGNLWVSNADARNSRNGGSNGFFKRVQGRPLVPLSIAATLTADRTFGFPRLRGCRHSKLRRGNSILVLFPQARRRCDSGLPHGGSIAGVKFHETK